MNDIGVIISVGVAFIAFILLLRTYTAIVAFVLDMRKAFREGFDTARAKRNGSPPVPVEYGSFIPGVPSESRMHENTAPAGVPVPTEEGTFSFNGVMIGQAQELDDDRMPTTPSHREDWQQDMDDLRSRNAMLVREVTRITEFFKHKQVIILTESKPWQKAIPAAIDDASSIIWIKTPRTTERSAKIYDYKFDLKEFQDVGQNQYGKVTQVLMNENDTLVRIQTLTAPNVLAIADRIGDTPKPQRRTQNLPPELRAYLDALESEDREMLRDFTGLDRNEPIKDGIAVGAHVARNIDLTD